MNELKPCPFCGGEGELLDYRTIFRVECKACQAGVNGDRAPEPESDEHCESINWDGYEKTALDRWNTRTQSECNEEIKRGIRVALRKLGNADIDEDSIKKFADDYVSSLPPKEPIK